MPGELSVRSVLRETAQELWRKRARLLFAILPALSAIALSDVLFLSFNDPGTLVSFIKSIVDLVLLALIGISVHRILLLGLDAVPRFGVSSWSMRETRFLGWWFLAGFYMSCTIAFVALPIALLGSAASHEMTIAVNVGTLIGYIVALILFARLSLLLPATAVDRREHMGWAFDLSRGSSFRLAVLVGLAPTASILLSYLSLLLPPLAFDVISWFFDWLLIVVGISLLSFSYQALCTGELEKDLI